MVRLGADFSPGLLAVVISLCFISLDLRGYLCKEVWGGGGVGGLSRSSKHRRKS